jgi:hypothetical protein
MTQPRPEKQTSGPSALRWYTVRFGAVLGVLLIIFVLANLGFGIIEMLLIYASIGFIVLGIKGFTKSALAVSPWTRLNGPSARIGGVICIIAGLSLIPLAKLAIAVYASMLARL